MLHGQVKKHLLPREDLVISTLDRKLRARQKYFFGNFHTIHALYLTQDYNEDYIQKQIIQEYMIQNQIIIMIIIMFCMLFCTFSF